ncbi:uncharacterized protein LOC143446793 isoform X2 [Clavelina lepadiformis]|uniref:uncharacterized protein LOC143446793 isoform X2 n=1 Tax=Clavelina lepadiformis TaxID=159417 RepID=UPI00404203C5
MLIHSHCHAVRLVSLFLWNMNLFIVALINFIWIWEAISSSITTIPPIDDNGVIASGLPLFVVSAEFNSTSYADQCAWNDTRGLILAAPFIDFSFIHSPCLSVFTVGGGPEVSCLYHASSSLVSTNVTFNDSLPAVGPLNMSLYCDGMFVLDLAFTVASCSVDSDSNPGLEANCSDPCGFNATAMLYCGVGYKENEKKVRCLLNGTFSDNLECEEMLDPNSTESATSNFITTIPPIDDSGVIASGVQPFIVSAEFDSTSHNDQCAWNDTRGLILAVPFINFSSGSCTTIVSEISEVSCSFVSSPLVSTNVTFNDSLPAGPLNISLYCDGRSVMDLAFTVASCSVDSNSYLGVKVDCPEPCGFNATGTLYCGIGYKEIEKEVHCLLNGTFSDNLECEEMLDPSSAESSTGGSTLTLDAIIGISVGCALFIAVALVGTFYFVTSSPVNNETAAGNMEPNNPNAGPLHVERRNDTVLPPLWNQHHNSRDYFPNARQPLPAIGTQA